VQTTTAALLQKECHCRSPGREHNNKEKDGENGDNTGNSNKTCHCSQFDLPLQQEGVIKMNAIVFSINNY
jgi:hypothetical protein